MPAGGNFKGQHAVLHDQTPPTLAHSVLKHSKLQQFNTHIELHIILGLLIRLNFNDTNL